MDDERNGKAVETLVEMAEGLRISIEAEDAVVSALSEYEAAWDAAKEARSVPIGLTRRIRQLQESKGQIRRWKRELDAYELALEALTSAAQQGDTP